MPTKSKFYKDNYIQKLFKDKLGSTRRINFENLGLLNEAMNLNINRKTYGTCKIVNDIVKKTLGERKKLMCDRCKIIGHDESNCEYYLSSNLQATDI